MRPSGSTILILALGILMAAAALGATSLADTGEDETYSCPPCGLECDDRPHEKPGRCPACGMTLVRKSDLMKVAIFVFDGVQIIDYTGPYEVFGQGGQFDVYTVSKTGKTITTAMGMSMNPKYAFADSPEPDVLVIPGGHVHGAQGDPEVLDWIRKTVGGADHVLTVCNGAFILASTGLLDGLSATTFYGLIDELRDLAPKVNVVSDRRYVDNGKIVTSAGLSSGIDGALHMISRIRGEGRAQAVALNLEYDWKPDSGYARAALADMRLPDLKQPEGARVTLLSTRGDTEGWERRWELRHETTVPALIEQIEHQLGSTESWTRGGSSRSSEGSGSTRWIFVDGSGVRWENEITVERQTGGDIFTITTTNRRITTTGM